MPFRTIWEKEGIKWEFYGLVTAEEIWEANRVFLVTLALKPQNTRSFRRSKSRMLNGIP